MYQITKTFSFEAAHHLVGLPEGHKCARQHGHSYTVTVALRCDELDATGFVVDYGMLNDLKIYIDRNLDHHDLNVVFPGIQTSAENIAMLLFHLSRDNFPWGKFIYSVTVQETSKTSATYYA